MIDGDVKLVVSQIAVEMLCHERVVNNAREKIIKERAKDERDGETHRTQRK